MKIFLGSENQQYPWFPGDLREGEKKKIECVSNNFMTNVFRHTVNPQILNNRSTSTMTIAPIRILK